MLSFFEDELGLTVDSVVADIGSGTGLSSRLFLENGNTVYGVEPNDGMRAAAEEYLNEFPNFRSVIGSADNTRLPDNSVDLVIAAQAFHWFEPSAARREFARILKPDSYTALIWNERQLDTTPFLSEYEQLLLKYANDYTLVRHENINDNRLGEFFGKPFSRKTFDNVQVFDFNGLKGRVLSSSYMPTESDERYGEMIGELGSLFAKYAEKDRIKILYDTRVYYTKL
jgi:ubiquinone/menaquinone biosynthesis C-methylase UbiE